MLRRDQLYAAGWICNQVDHELDIGRWRRLAPEVLSHGSACSRGGLQGWEHDVIHVMTRKGQAITPMPDFRFHQTRRAYLPWVLPDSASRRLRLEPATLLTAERERTVRSVSLPPLCSIVCRARSRADPL